MLKLTIYYLLLGGKESNSTEKRIIQCSRCPMKASISCKIENVRFLFHLLSETLNQTTTLNRELQREGGICMCAEGVLPQSACAVEDIL